MKFLFKWLRCKLFHGPHEVIGIVFNSNGRFTLCECGISKRS